jgi:phosphatidate cytidylyltransferase|tara:strand:- start:18 stop:674 length:657 start_codon:yes stop_codon:yes gene_type:complete
MSNELLKRISTSVLALPILFAATIYSGVLLILLLVLVYFLCVYEVIKNTRNISFNLFANILLIFSFCSFYYLRGDTEYSLIILSWILIATFLSDIGGYVFGKIFKGKKLTKISPNKTYSGSLGSVVLSCLSMPLLNALQYFFSKELLVNFLKIDFLVFTILISLVCQLGDLFVSFWKRKIKIKNISNILPGHGGIIDRIDGLIFVLIFGSILKSTAVI